MTELVKKEKSDYDELIAWVITIPAIWNEPAKQFMREAAIEVNNKIERSIKLLYISRYY